MIVTTLNCPVKGEFSALNGTKCLYRMFDRHHGVSSGLYDSLNIGCDVGDQQTAVRENRRRIKETLGLSTMLTAKQIHGDGVYCLTDVPGKDREIADVDALITNLPGIGLMIQQADCQAVLLFDPVKEVISAVHCGWRGSVQQILTRVMSVLRDNYGTAPEDVLAVISPSLGPCCAEFVNFRQELPGDFTQFMVRDNYFDFWQISKYQLTCAGLLEKNITVAGICTCCSDDYFSYRRASRKSGGQTGRNCSVISLQKNL